MIFVFWEFLLKLFEFKKMLVTYLFLIKKKKSIHTVAEVQDMLLVTSQENLGDETYKEYFHSNFSCLSLPRKYLNMNAFEQWPACAVSCITEILKASLRSRT